VRRLLLVALVAVVTSGCVVEVPGVGTFSCVQDSAGTWVCHPIVKVGLGR
jgi:hypothetical protein